MSLLVLTNLFGCVCDGTSQAEFDAAVHFLMSIVVNIDPPVGGEVR